MNFGEASGEAQNLPRGVRHVFGGSQNLPRQVRHVFVGSQKLPRGVRLVFGGSQKLPRGVRQVFAEVSASHSNMRHACGSFRKLTQVCGTFAEVSASSLKCAGRLRKFPQASRKCAGRLRKFPQAHSSVRGVCGSFRKHSSIFSETIAPSPKIKAGNPQSIPANFPLLAMETKGYFRASSILSFNLSMVPKPVCS